ncbi:hypothetical protein [Methylophaga sulfidovorans]|uniref:Uncharacterized protein n=1 Tax=Methylophaga sulfidovorans TaxID=45496 RepID=A0A1I3UXW0_9GAMM|nr:hypothetical protein [Methylophaga sulfidovorans]SFJ86916.1 hypothetical protein SAMN04488079_102123 [Methylophaga sulfidovorans]
MKSLLPIFILFFLSINALGQFALADSEAASDFIVFKTIEDKDTSSDCTQRGGLRIYVENTHPDKTIDLSLDRYFSTVRQAGRSMFALENGHSQPLGCNIVMDSEQHWELINAEFISKEDAIKRYGTLY